MEAYSKVNVFAFDSSLMKEACDAPKEFLEMIYSSFKVLTQIEEGGYHVKDDPFLFNKPKDVVFKEIALAVEYVEQSLCFIDAEQALAAHVTMIGIKLRNIESEGYKEGVLAPKRFTKCKEEVFSEIDDVVKMLDEILDSEDYEDSHYKCSLSPSTD